MINSPVAINKIRRQNFHGVMKEKVEEEAGGRT